MGLFDKLTNSDSEPMREEDITKVVLALPDALKFAMSKHPTLMVGGGFIRDTLIGVPPKDIDVFGPDGQIRDGAKKHFDMDPNAELEENELVTTITSEGHPPVQYVTGMDVLSQLALIRRIDFHCCRAVVRCVDGRWYGWVSPKFYGDLAANLLRWGDPERQEHPVASIHHAARLIGKGWKMPKMEMCRLVHAAMVRYKGTIPNVPDIYKDMTGVEYTDGSES